MKKIGFIGAGNMASAIIKGISQSKIATAVFAFDIDEKKLENLRQYGVSPCENTKQLLKNTDYLLLAVKPQNITEVLTEIAPFIPHETVIISICAGITPSYIKKALGYQAKVVQVMPNTPLMLSVGATALSRDDIVSDEEFAFVKSVFDCAGITEVISCDKMNEIIPINGSSPAFIYQFAAEFISYAKSVDIDEKVALRLFAQTLVGSAKMLTESGKTVDELITMVSSKGGTTIAGLNAMKENGFSGAVKSACEDCVKRAYELTLE